MERAIDSWRGKEQKTVLNHDKVAVHVTYVAKSA